MSNGQTNNYLKIWEECYAELSAEGKAKADKYVNHVLRMYQRHERRYSGLDENDDKSSKTIRMGLGETSARELIIALMMKGHL